MILLCFLFSLSVQSSPFALSYFTDGGGEISQDQTICFGDLADPIIESGVPSFAGPYEYMWMQLVPGSPTLNSWNVIPGANGPTYQPPFLYQQIQYIRCVRPLGSIGDYLETNVVTITIVPDAIANITYGVSTATQFDILNFNSAFSTNSTYLWDFGDGNTCNTQNCSYSYNEPGTYTVTLTVTNAYGCVSTTSYIVNIVPSPLPVKLVSFDAIDNKDGSILIRWATESEVDNEYFDLEISEDGISFRPIATLEGMGTTNELVTYSYTDQNPYYGFNYYRLKQVDFNGEFEYSDIISVRITEGMEVFSLYPNPVSNDLNFKVNMPIDGDSFIEILNMYGQIVTRVKPTNSSISNIDVSDLPTGTYLIAFYQANEKIYTSRFSKVD